MVSSFDFHFLHIVCVLLKYNRNVFLFYFFFFATHPLFLKIRKKKTDSVWSLHLIFWIFVFQLRDLCIFWIFIIAMYYKNYNIFEEFMKYVLSCSSALLCFHLLLLLYFFSSFHFCRWFFTPFEILRNYFCIHSSLRAHHQLQCLLIIIIMQ